METVDLQALFERLLGASDPFLEMTVFLQERCDENARRRHSAQSSQRFHPQPLAGFPANQPEGAAA